MMRLGAVVLILGCASGAEVGRIAGTLRNQVTGAPIAGARVTLELNQPGGPASATLTAANGRFVFQNVPSGKHVLSAQRRGYVAGYYGQSAMGGGAAVVVGPGEKSDSIDFRLPPASAIGGRVVDQNGEPVAEALVQLLHSTPESGRRRIHTDGFQYTDDAGEYRFPSLRATDYYICVAGQPWYAQQVEGAGNLPQCYGSGGNPSAAARLSPKAGQDIQADLTLTARRGVAVTVGAGACLNCVVSLVASGPEGADWALSAQAGGGLVRYHAVAPGTYWVVTTRPSGEAIFRRQAIEVGETDMTVALRAETPAIVEGKAHAVARKPAAGPVTVFLQDLQSGQPLQREVGPGGIFRFDGVPPARYTVDVVTAARDVYLAALSVKGAPLEGRTLDLRDASEKVQMEATVRGDGGVLAGKVERDGSAAVGVLVIVVPREEPGNATDYKLYVTDGDGSFEFTGVRPGVYQVFAAESQEIEYANPAVVRPWRKSAKVVEVEVEANGRHRVELQVTANPK